MAIWTNLSPNPATAPFKHYCLGQSWSYFSNLLRKPLYQLHINVVRPSLPFIQPSLPLICKTLFTSNYLPSFTYPPSLLHYDKQNVEPNRNQTSRPTRPLSRSGSGTQGHGWVWVFFYLFLGWIVGGWCIWDSRGTRRCLRGVGYDEGMGKITVIRPWLISLVVPPVHAQTATPFSNRILPTHYLPSSMPSTTLSVPAITQFTPHITIQDQS